MPTLRCLLASLVLIGCGDGASADAGSPGLDAGSGLDAAAADAGPPDEDAGTGDDAGALDAAGPDAGSTDAGPVDCAGAVVDEPCSAEGAFCGGPCTDECSFCNLLSCSGGTWNRVEVFPRPCFACGDSLRCVTGEAHCVHSFSDVGGVPDTYACADNPSGCTGDTASCTCLEAELTFDECVAPNPGELEIRYFGG